MVSVNKALRTVKEDVAKLLDPESIFRICRMAGHKWYKSRLNPAVLIHLFVMQILSGNTACTHLRQLSGLEFSASAYCQGRMRLPLKVIQLVVRRVCQRFWRTCDESSRWLGHRVWQVDGSSASMPDTPELQQHFGQPGGQKAGCGFPVASTLSLMHAGTGLLMNLLVRPLRTHEMSGIVSLHGQLKPNDVMVADRGFCSYAHLCLVLQSETHAVFRIHQRIVVNFEPNRRSRAQFPKSQQKGKPNSRYIRKLGHQDQVVEYLKPKERPNWMTQEQYDALPDSIRVRELRYRIHRRGFRTRSITLVTTLTDSQKYPAKELARLYGDRWAIEVDFRHLKSTMGMEVLHCKTVQGVMKELWIYMLVYNLVRQVILEAARSQGSDPDRISFIDALRWLCCAQPDEKLIILIVNPLRSGRVEPRVIKRRMKQYPLMTKPRRELRQELINAQLTD